MRSLSLTLSLALSLPHLLMLTLPFAPSGRPAMLLHVLLCVATIPSSERAHFSQCKTAQALYDAVVARYSSPSSATLSRLMLPFLFPDLASFPTVADLVTHLRASDTRYPRLPFLLSSALRTLLPCTSLSTFSSPVSLSPFVSLGTSFSLGVVLPPCCPLSPLPLRPTSPVLSRSARRLPPAADAALARARGARERVELEGAVEEAVGVAGGVGVAVGVVAGVEVLVAAVEAEVAAEVVAEEAVGAVGATVLVGEVAVETGVAVEAGVGVARPSGAALGVVSASSSSRSSSHSSSSALAPSPPLSSSVSGTCSVSVVVRLVPAPTFFAPVTVQGRRCGGAHTARRCFGRLTDAWRQQFPEAAEIPRWGELSRAGVAIYDLDFDAILAAMYAVTGSDEDDCYRCFPPDPGIGTCRVRDRTTLTPLSRPVAVSLADPSGGLGADLQDAGVHQFTPARQRVTHCTEADTGRHLATFTRRPGSSLYTLTTASPPGAESGRVPSSGQVFAAASRSGPESAPYSCRRLSHETLLWHHRLGPPLSASAQRHGLASPCVWSSRSLPPLPPGPGPTCVPCVEGRQRAAPHSSQFPPTEAPLQTLHMDVWGPARVRGQGQERYFLLVVDDYSRYTTVFPLRSKGEVTEINLHPRVSRPETSPALLWTGKVGDASAFRFYHPTSRRVLSSQDVTFDESVPYYRLFPYRTPSLPPPPLFLVDAVEPVEVTGDSGAAAGAEPGVRSLGVLSLGVLCLGVLSLEVPSLGVLCLGVLSLEPGGAVPGGASSRREPLSPQELREWFARRWRRAAGAGGSSTAEGSAADASRRCSYCGLPLAVRLTVLLVLLLEVLELLGATGGAAGGAAGVGAPAGAAGAVPAVSSVAARPRPYFVPLLQQVLGLTPPPPPPLEGPQPVQSQPQLLPASPLPAPSPYAGPTGGLTERREPASRPVSPVRTERASGRGSRQRPPPVPGTHRMSLRPSTAPLRAPLPSPPASSLPALADPESDSLRAASPTLVDFAARCRLDYAARLVTESESACPPSVGGECALGTDVLEDRQEEFQCLAAASPRLASVLLAPEGDPDAPDIPTPRSYAEAIEGPYSSQWQAAMDAEMASWKSTGTYVDRCSPSWGRTSGVLRRPVYGLRQAPREWHDTLRTTLAALGFAPSTADPSLFLRTDTSLPPFYILVYVDDLVFATADTAGLAYVKSELQKRHTHRPEHMAAAKRVVALLVQYVGHGASAWRAQSSGPSLGTQTLLGLTTRLYAAVSVGAASAPSGRRRSSKGKGGKGAGGGWSWRGRWAVAAVAAGEGVGVAAGLVAGVVVVVVAAAAETVVVVPAVVVEAAAEVEAAEVEAVEAAAEEAVVVEAVELVGVVPSSVAAVVVASARTAAAAALAGHPFTSAAS
ncbi:unnamed protein product [Closterium sp. NIES-64]|nr:unnamed protein product [Closterium sp. NIES-64]